MSNENRKRVSKLCVIQCAWEDCHSTVTLQPSEYQTFSDHLKVHADEFVLRVKSEMDGDEDKTVGCCCMWRDCTWEGCEDLSDLIRHIMFHGYHALLKALGQLVQKKLNLNECTIEVDDHYHMLSCVTSPFICYWQECGTEFLCPDKYYRHVESHVVNSVGHYDDSNQLRMACQWGECSNLFRDKHKLKEHVRVHTHEKLFACPGCGGLFSNRTKLLDHLSRQNVAAYENFQCSHCLKRCASERLLRDHMRHHVNYLKCPHCDMTCPNPGSLKYHIHYRHSDERPFSCSMCDHSFKSNSDLIRHEESHLMKSYVCNEPGCDYSTKTAHCLRRHVKIAHTVGGAKRYICHVCNHAYSRGFGLTKHLKKQHNFSWPSGHPRFRYIEYDDGLFRLQMVRFESVELTKRLQRDNAQEDYGDEEIVENNGDFNNAEAVNALEMKYPEGSMIVDAVKLNVGDNKAHGTEDDMEAGLSADIEVGELSEMDCCDGVRTESIGDDITQNSEIMNTNAINTSEEPLIAINVLSTSKEPINALNTSEEPINALDTSEEPMITLRTSEEPITATYVVDKFERESEKTHQGIPAANKEKLSQHEVNIDASVTPTHEFGLYLQPKPAGYNTDIMSQITAFAKSKSKKRQCKFVDSLYKQLVKDKKLRKPPSTSGEKKKRQKLSKMDTTPCVQVEVTVDGCDTSDIVEDDTNEKTIDSSETSFKLVDDDQINDKWGLDQLTSLSTSSSEAHTTTTTTTEKIQRSTPTAAETVPDERETRSKTMHIPTCTASTTTSYTTSANGNTSLLNSTESRDQQTQTVNLLARKRKSADDETSFEERVLEDIKVVPKVEDASLSTFIWKLDEEMGERLDVSEALLALKSV